MDLARAKREAFVYALSMKANNLSIIKSRLMREGLGD